MPRETSGEVAPLAVAIVAPSLSILGGQAVQARRLLDAWRDDREISAFLVPINPDPPSWMRPLVRVKYLRTLVTQLIYLPSLVRAAATRRRRPCVLGVVLVIPARAPAGGNSCATARTARPRQLSQRRSAGPPSPLGHRPLHPALGRPEHRAIPIPATGLRRSTPSRPRSSPTSSTPRGSLSGCATRCSHDSSPLATSNRSTTWRCTLRAFGAVQTPLSRGDADPRRNRIGGRIAPAARG